MLVSDFSFSLELTGLYQTQFYSNILNYNYAACVLARDIVNAPNRHTLTTETCISNLSIMRQKSTGNQASLDPLFTELA